MNDPAASLPTPPLTTTNTGNLPTENAPQPVAAAAAPAEPAPAAPAPAASSSTGSSSMLDGLVNAATNGTDPAALAATIAAIGNARDVTLRSTMAGGQDPLAVLDVRRNTLLVLWILCVFLHEDRS